MHLSSFIISSLITWVLLFPGTSSAHIRNESFSKWRFETTSEAGFESERVYVSVTMKIKTARRMNWNIRSGNSFKQVFLNHTVNNMALIGDGSPCPVSGEPKIFFSPEAGYIRAEWQVRCPPGRALTIENNAYFENGPNHIHIARIAIENEPIVEKLFTSRERHWEIRSKSGIRAGNKPARPAGSSLFSYWIIGLEHIISGFDHLAFLLGLMLLCRRAHEMIILVTGFTLGHTMTLGLGALNVITPDSASVEALIGFTIALVAIENIGERTGTNHYMGLVTGLAGLAFTVTGAFILKAGPQPLTMAGITLFSACYLGLISRIGEKKIKLRPAVTVLFGLIHGFGFAGSLKEIGLPADRFFSALFGFNLGVESGQLIIVFLLWLTAITSVRLLPMLQQRLRQRLLSDIISASLCGLGVFWFISRAYS